MCSVRIAKSLTPTRRLAQLYCRPCACARLIAIMPGLKAVITQQQQQQRQQPQRQRRRRVQALGAMMVCALLLCILAPCQAATRVVDRDATLLRFDNTPPDADGNFAYAFQTSNALIEKRAGNANGFSGVVQYVSLEGLPITWSYVADANGYHPEGDAIPATPPHVLASLEYIRTHPAVNERDSRSL